MWIGLREDRHRPTAAPPGNVLPPVRACRSSMPALTSCRPPPPLSARPMTGFTLIELMLVVAISIILATLASSELRRVTEMSREQNAIAQVRDSLAAARYKARRELVPTSFFTAHNAIVVENSQSGAKVIPFNAVIHHIDVSTQNQKVTFTSGGGLTSSGTVTVSAVLRSGRTQNFLILPAIGSIREQ